MVQHEKICASKRSNSTIAQWVPEKVLLRIYALVLDANLVLDMVEEERVRNLLILEHTQAASDSLEADSSAGKAMAQEAMENTSVVRLNSSLLLIAQKVAERLTRKVGPTTFLS